MNKPAYQMSILCILLSASTALSAHQLPFKKLTQSNQRVIVKTNFELNEQDIIKQYHYRAKFFDIEKWMMSQQLTLHNDHAEVGQIGAMAQTRRLQSGDTVELDTEGGFHGVVDPITRLSVSDMNAFETNTVINRINIAGLVAVSLCNAYAAVNIKTTSGTLKPKFIGPSSFLQGINPATASQSLYSLSEGIQFSCVAPMTISKPLPREKVRDLKQLHKPAMKQQGS